MFELGHLVEDRPEQGMFKVRSDVFSDPELFQLEMKHIFEKTWLFIGLESEIPKPGDFMTAMLARTPILVTRHADGTVRGMVNVCRHKSAIVCRADKGNSNVFTCPYHGWSYDTAGANVGIKEQKAGAYAAAFEQERLGLTALPRLESYKGLIFGSLSHDVPSLVDYLGEMRVFIDLAMDQGPHGMEFVPGRVLYTYRGNWKLQADNGMDPYHLTSTHTSFMKVQDRRRAGSGNQAAKQYDWAKRGAIQHGNFSFPRGHSTNWMEQAEPEKKQIFQTLDEIKARVGAVRAQWMLAMRQSSIFPTLGISEGSALILRTYRPLAVNLTEMNGRCLAPIGEKPELRAWRIRQFEDFFNPGGMATPDDAMVYEDCQAGFEGAPGTPLLGYLRGTTLAQEGADHVARELGITPLSSTTTPFKTFIEVGMQPLYREWMRLMQAGLSGEKAYS